MPVPAVRPPSQSYPRMRMNRVDEAAVGRRKPVELVDGGAGAWRDDCSQDLHAAGSEGSSLMRSVADQLERLGGIANDDGVCGVSHTV